MHPALLISVFAGKIASSFCWMLIHSLWQGLLFTVITGVLLLVTKRSSAVLRYNIMVVLFFLFIAVCACTFIWEWNSTELVTGTLQTSGAGIINQTGIQLLFKNLSAYFSANASLIVMVWCIVFLAKCVKMAAGLVYSQRVKHHKIQQPPLYWQNKITALCSQLHIRQKVQLFQSGIVKIPVVIGHLKPIIFIPVGLLTSLPAGEIEAVLLHELAHIRRNDYFVNIIQVIAENIFFFNPALLWISSLLRDERENCCDDVAVAETKSKKQFIQALISFKEHALHTNNFTTAFPARKNQLLHRASRIITNSNKTLNPAEKVFFAASFIVLAMLSLAFTGSTGVHAAFVRKQAAVATVQPAVIDAPATVENPLQPQGDKTAAVGYQRLIAYEDARRQYNKSRKQYAAVKPNVQDASYKAYEYEYTRINVTRYQGAGNSTGDVKKPAQTQLTDAQQAELDRIQAVKDREQAEKDRKQAELDRVQAEKDRLQAVRDRLQADKDRQQAELDRQQAEGDRLQAEKEKNGTAV